MADAQLPSKILIVDDDQAFVQALETGLEKHKIKVFKAYKLETAHYLFNQNKFEVALVETDFGELPGLALIQKWRNHDLVDRRFCGIIAMGTQNGSASDAALIRELGDVELINKPFTAFNILAYLTRAMEARTSAMQFNEFKTKILDVHKEAGSIDKAIAAIQGKANVFGPKAQDALFRLYENAGKFEEGLAVVSKQLTERPTDIVLLNAKGRLLMRMGRFKEAQPILEKADEIAPMNIDRINEMGEMYLKVNQPEKCVKKFNELVKLNPEQQDLKFDLLNKLYDHNFNEQGRMFARQNAGPSEIIRHFNNKGVFLAKSGKENDALSEYIRALEFYPKYKENYRIHFNIALAYAARKTPDDLKKAREHLQKCLDLEPSFEKGKNILDQIEKALSKKAS